VANRITNAWAALRGKSQPSLTQKDIWGQTWQAFMGMQTDEGGINPIEDSPGAYTRAMTAESYIYRCSEVRGRAISQVPLKAWQTAPNGIRKPIDHDALAILLNASPVEYNYITGTALMRYTLNSLDFHGHAAWNLAFSRKNLPSEIYWQIPTTYTPVPDPQKFFGGIRINTQNGVKTLPPEQVCYFKTDSLDEPLLGTSKIKVLRNAINLRMYAARSNIDFFRNSMRPDWILSGDWKNTEENVEGIKRGLRRHFSGESNRQPMVIGEGATAHLLTMAPKDAEWLAQQRLSQEEISAAFGVPLIYLNNFDRATYDNIKTAKLVLWHDTIIPESTILAEWLNQQFLWRFWPETQKQKIALGFDYNEVNGLGEDVALVWERFNSFMQRIDEQVQHRVLTPDQARLALEQFAGNLGIIADPWKGKQSPELRGDTHMLPFNNVPVEQLNIQAIIDIEAARSSNPNAAALIESVPGAPNATANSQAVLQRIDEQLQNQADMAQARQATPQSNPSASTRQRALPEHRLVRKGPHPIAVRNARLAPIQGRLVRRLKRHFQDLKNEAMRNMRATTILTASPQRPTSFSLETTKAPIDPNVPLWDETDAKVRLAALVRIGVRDAIGAAYSASAEDYDLEVAWNEDNLWLEKYMGSRLKYINGVDDNLRDQLRGALLASAQAGDSIPAMSDKVREVFQDAMDYRAELIARTETIQAYGAASLQSYREAGIAQAEMYDGSDDDECSAVDGQVVSLSEAEQLMGEEHPNGTRGMAPIVDLGYGEADDADQIEAAAPKPFSKEIIPGITLVA
jgi:HK97 family phage portal protein